MNGPSPAARAPRIIDVARLAGVSTATVSRALNGMAVRPEHGAAVERAVSELGYRPNRAARSLRRRHSDVIALLVPDIENPFFTAVARGVEDHAQQAGYSVVLCNTDDLAEKEADYVAIAREEHMAGIIVAPAGAALDAATGRGPRQPVVVIDREVEADTDQIVFDNVELGYSATRQLLARGLTRVACVTGPSTVSTAVQRAQGWRRALEEWGLPADDELLRYANFRVDGGQRAMRSLMTLASAPDGVLATNNLVGVGVLRELSLLPPTSRPELAVVGELPFATTALPAGVVVPLRPREMGIEAARMLVERIEGLQEPARRVVLRTGL